MTLAAIDIGTNTVLLLIAKVETNSNQIIPIRNEYRIPRIGKGLKPNSEISADRINLLFEVLKNYQKIIQSYKCEKVYAVGTNALRIASNSAEIKKAIKQKFDFELEVISGDLEAKYAYLGATNDINEFSSAFVIDIGGGSTEVILGSKENIFYKKSFNIGSVSATENFLKNSPPLKKEKEILVNEIITLFMELKEKYEPEITIAVAGTATTLACMNKGLKEFIDEIDGSHISVSELKELIEVIENLTSAEIKEKYGVITNGREDVIYAGALILFELMKLLKINQVMISSKGIRYGVIAASLRQKN